MNSVKDDYLRDYQRLVEYGKELLVSMKLKRIPDFEKELQDKYKDGYSSYVDTLPNFQEDYQSWYSESKSLIKQVLPDRLLDFVSYYEIQSNRQSLDYGNYTISDYLLNTVRKNGYGNIIVEPSAAIHKFTQQIAILKSVEAKFKSSLFNIRSMVQADLFDSEIDCAEELLTHNFIRAAGAISGVVLESHLRKICENNQLLMEKKNPCISDYNETLKKEEIIDVPNWRFIQHLADIRNLCDHKKDEEPKKEQIEDLIYGVRKIIKTIV